MKSIHQHIQSDINELSDPQISAQRRRHIEGELKSLENYRDNHPNDDHDPTTLELFCNENPGAEECRVYED